LLRLDGESGVPYYLQVVQQVKRLITSGAIAPGDQLPTVRDMASDLVLNPNTIAKAYQELERDGVVETRRGLGTFACTPASTLSDLDRKSAVTAMLKKLMIETSQMGVTMDEVLSLLNKLVEENHEQRIAS
jgi:GntR family transcriptional regulator